jgi:acetyl-CoA acetyltransferase
MIHREYQTKKQKQNALTFTSSGDSLLAPAAGFFFDIRSVDVMKKM